MEMSARLKMARKLMDTLKPKAIRLKPGQLKRIDKDLIVEKTSDGKITIYEQVS
jgi:hypothetical protein